MSDLINRIKEHEGYRRFAYLCPAGKLTIGYGTRIDEGGQGVPTHIAELLLRTYVGEIREELVRCPWWRPLEPVRQDVIVEMAYQLGIGGVYKFQRMIHALGAKNYATAAAEMLDSKWAKKDTPARANRLAKIMASGVV